MSQHQMITRSMKKSMNIDINNNNNNNNNNNDPPKEDIEDDIDEYGNIKGLIDYSYDKKKKISKKKKKSSLLNFKNKVKSRSIEEMALSYLLMNMFNNTNNHLINLKNKAMPLFNIEVDISDVDSEGNNEEEEEDIMDEEIMDEDNESTELEVKIQKKMMKMKKMMMFLNMMN